MLNANKMQGKITYHHIRQLMQNINDFSTKIFRGSANYCSWCNGQNVSVRLLILLSQYRNNLIKSSAKYKKTKKKQHKMRTFVFHSTKLKKKKDLNGHHEETKNITIIVINQAQPFQSWSYLN